MIYVGTSGYSYPDWIGPFYPAGLKSGAFLGHYARHFPAVEVDYTYYRLPSAATLAGMDRRTPPGFRFAAKATSLLTHEREATPADFAAYCAGVAPLVAAGKLGAVLAQFPFSFANSEAHRTYLHHLRQGLGDLPVVVEFRHVSWIIEPVFALLRELGLGFCCVDQPRFAKFVPPVARATSTRRSWASGWRKSGRWPPRRARRWCFSTTTTRPRQPKTRCNSRRCWKPRGWKWRIRRPLPRPAQQTARGRDLP